MKKNYGITLVALIITITVMLILVGVVVQVVIQSDLLGTAKNVGDEYEEAYEKEKSISGIKINEKVYDSIEDYLNGKESIPEIHKWKRNGDNLECEHCNKKFTIGQPVDYVDNGTGVSTISGEKSGASEAIASGKLKAADFGINGEQTVHKDGETKWIILGIEDTNKNGINETLLLTTEIPTTEQIYFYGEANYNNGVTEINRICKEIYGEEARGINVNDVNECLQYEPPVGTYGMKTDRAPQYFTINEHLKISELGEYYNNKWSLIKENSKGTYYTPEFPNGTTDENVLGDWKIEGYSYSVDENSYLPVANNVTEVAKSVVCTSDGYWLASRSAEISYYNYVTFGIGSAGGISVQTSSYCFNSTGWRNAKACSFRPVISLRDNIPNVVE